MARSAVYTRPRKCSGIVVSKDFDNLKCSKRLRFLKTDYEKKGPE